MAVFWIVQGLVVATIIFIAPMIRIIREYEGAILYRFGAYKGVLEPGLRFVLPFGIDKLYRWDLRVLVNDVPGLTLTLDYCHFTCNGTPDDRIEPLAEFASHFHVRGAANGRLQASFKDNVIDYKRVVDALDEAGYSGYIGLEYVWIDWEHCNECDNLSETILYRDFFRGL